MEEAFRASDYPTSPALLLGKSDFLCWPEEPQEVFKECDRIRVVAGPGEAEGTGSGHGEDAD